MLEELRKLTATSLTDRKAVHRSGLNLEHVVLDQADKLADQQKDQLIDHLKNDELTDLQALYETFETNLENDFVNDFFEGPTSWERLESYILYKRFVGLISNEIRLCNLSASDNVAFIGSGPFPVTALLLYRLAGVNVTCYEHYLPAAKISRRLMQELGVDQQITVKHQPGQQIDASEYHAVVVALLAKPKKQILHQLVETAPDNCRIICRTSDGIRQVFYETTGPSDLNNLSILRKITAEGDQTISSFLLKLP
jgi:Nicotianamine synthase protein